MMMMSNKMEAAVYVVIPETSQINNTPECPTLRAEQKCLTGSDRPIDVNKPLGI